MAQLVLIGTFSTMTRLSVKALRRYDELGLLRPAKVDASSGYRYYALSQAGRAESIRRLRALDMPIEEIKRVLAASPADVSGLLAEHRRRLRVERDRHDHMLAVITRLINGEESLMHYAITVEALPTQTVASVRCHTDLAGISATIAEGFGTLMGVLTEAGRHPAGSPFLVFHDVIDADNDGDIDVCIPIESPVAAPPPVQVGQMAAATAAVTTHRGRYDEIASAYHALTTWIAEHGHEIAGPPRETYLNDPAVTAEADLLTQVAWPIR
ncbi:MerR family transcriptional regulator [Streptosporangium sp. NBC_01755]|uniref:MerR family transcriptional regulator n=1 Tax=unclassified Streptosporangium TaxID=2632669 RepID=UPI002DDAF054|nr:MULTISPECIES: MerR family transcriptional regulator [unclassified Streptosporangium]WSA25449.1 MerR family transcriptional regulator [Streptosporangium sp. NBC_01810]WSD03162.1 MerR family transcriptional regulator [Streptosporangium sp. NBC_01755]